MSLINEALKKAQKQRAHEPTLVLPSGAPSIPPRVIKRAQPMAAQKLVLIGAFCLFMFLLVGGGAWFIISQVSAPAPAPTFTPKSTTAQAVQSAASPATATEGVDQPSGTTTAVSASAQMPDGVASKGDPSTATSPASSTVSPTQIVTGESTVPSSSPISSPEPAAATAAAPIVAAFEVIPSPTPRPAPQPRVQVLAMVDAFKVAGIRASTSDPKVLMNDRVFRVNDVVDRTHGLRLTEINPDRIIFVDDIGATYTKTF